MSEETSLRSVGLLVAVVGLLVLSAGLAMPATKTTTSTTCVNDPTGFGQDCFRGSVETPNPLRGPTVGLGLLALLGGGALAALGGSGSGRSPDPDADSAAVEGGFAEKLRAHRAEPGEHAGQASVGSGAHQRTGQRQPTGASGAQRAERNPADRTARRTSSGQRPRTDRGDGDTGAHSSGRQGADPAHGSTASGPRPRSSQSPGRGDPASRSSGRHDPAGRNRPGSRPRESASGQSLHARIPGVVGYPVATVVGLLAGVIAFGILAALVGVQDGLGALFGVVVGTGWGVGAWYGLGRADLEMLPVSFTYLLVAATGWFALAGLFDAVGIPSTTASGKLLFVLGQVALLAGWHAVRTRFLDGFPATGTEQPEQPGRQ